MHRITLAIIMFSTVGCGGANAPTAPEPAPATESSGPSAPVALEPWDRDDERACRWAEANDGHDGVLQCGEHVERLAGLAKQGKLREATALVDHCGDSCTGECAKLWKQIEADTPTLMVMAPGPPYEVHIDGEALVCDEGHSAAMVVDPGAHKLTVKTPDSAPKEHDLIVARGDKNRLVQFP